MKRATYDAPSPTMRVAVCEAILSAATVSTPDRETSEDDLFTACQRRAHDENLGYLSRRTVIAALLARGLSRRRADGGIWLWEGIALR